MMEKDRVMGFLIGAVVGGVGVGATMRMAEEVVLAEQRRLETLVVLADATGTGGCGAAELAGLELGRLAGMVELTAEQRKGAYAVFLKRAEVLVADRAAGRVTGYIGMLNGWRDEIAGVLSVEQMAVYERSLGRIGYSAGVESYWYSNSLME